MKRLSVKSQFVPNDKNLTKAFDFQKQVNANALKDFKTTINYTQLNSFKAQGATKPLKIALNSFNSHKPEASLVRAVSSDSVARFCDKFKGGVSQITRDLLFAENPAVRENLRMAELLLCAITKVVQQTKTKQNKFFIYRVFMELTGKTLGATKWYLGVAMRFGLISCDRYAQALTVPEKYRDVKGKLFVTVKNAYLINGGKVELSALKFYSNALLHSVKGTEMPGLDCQRFTTARNKLLLEGVSDSEDKETLRRIAVRNIRILEKMGMIGASHLPDHLDGFGQATGGFIYFNRGFNCMLRVLCLRLVAYVNTAKKNIAKFYKRLENYLFRLKCYFYRKFKTGRAFWRYKFEPAQESEGPPG